MKDRRDTPPTPSTRREYLLQNRPGSSPSHVQERFAGVVREHPRSRDKDAPLLLGSALALTLSLVLLALTALTLFYTIDWILPGVSSLGVDLSRRTTVEAAMLLQAEWQSRTIEVEAAGFTWTVSPDSLGISLDAAATAELALAQGRSLASLRRWLEGERRISLEPIWHYDPVRAEAFLQEIAAGVAVEPRNAGLCIEHGRLVETKAVPGRALDLVGAQSYLAENSWAVYIARKVSLPIVPMEPEIVDASQAADQATRWLAGPVAVRLYDPIRDESITWTITPEVIGDWLTVGVDPVEPRQLACTLNEEGPTGFLAARAAELGSDREIDFEAASDQLREAMAAVDERQRSVRLRIYHRPRQHIVEEGETFSSLAAKYGIPYPWLQEANPRSSDDLRAGQAIVIPSPDVMLPLPPVEGKRIVVSVADQRVRVYEDGALKWDWPASTGVKSSPTLPGVFQIQSHEPEAYASRWNLWMPFFMGIYEPIPNGGFMNGFHGFPWREGRQILWRANLGHPVTYGCVLISTENAELLYGWAEDGVVVEIQP